MKILEVGISVNETTDVLPPFSAAGEFLIKLSAH